MNFQFLIIILLAIPLIGTAAVWFSPDNYKRITTVHISFAIASSLVALLCVANVVDGETMFAFNQMLFLDSLGGVFLSLIAVTGLLVNLYSVKYMQWEIDKNEMSVKDTKLYFALAQLFIFTMTLSTVSNNIAFMWIAVEATTLSSLFMVAIHKGKRSTESGWKYIVVCSIGLAFALYATVLLYSAGFAVIQDAHSTMLWTTLRDHAKEIDPDALKLIFVFALIGYGTKAGLAPTHTWLPDVHSEGPAPASAMLSGILLKCAMLALVRYYSIVGNSMVGFEYVQTLMIVSGLITIGIASLFLLRQHDVKRMFAYHSIAHMGVIAFGIGVGGFIGVFAALFHTLAHSVTKSLAFCVTGNMVQIYGTRDMTKMGGLMKIAPITGILFAIAIMSLVGVPGFAIFVSEFMMVKGAVANGMVIPLVLFVIGLVIIFIADFSHFNLAAFGESKTEVLSREVSWKANLPLIGLAALIIIFGLFSVGSWVTLLTNAVNIVIA